MKVFVHFEACIEMEMNDRYAALKDEENYFNERLAADCMTEAEFKLCGILPCAAFDIEAYSITDEDDNILTET